MPKKELREFVKRLEEPSSRVRGTRVERIYRTPARFGRLQKHLEEIKNQKLVNIIEKMMGKPIPDEDKKYLVHGPDEIDLVNSGLEETMVSAYQEIRSVHHSKVPKESLRTAAFIIAINKVALTYQQLGIFP